MIGIPVTTFTKYLESSTAYIIAIDADDIMLKEIDSIQIVNETITDKLELLTTESELTDLNKSILDMTITNQFNFTSSIVYLLLGKTDYPYLSTTKFVVYGKRIGYPIKNNDSLIDIPNEFLELFIKYAIREAAELTGKIVPPSIQLDINSLESELGV